MPSTLQVRQLSPPTVLPFDKLETLLRGPLVVLYDEQLDLALSFAAITAKGIIQHEILPRALMHAPDELYTYRRWEAVLCSLFSGILVSAEYVILSLHVINTSPIRISWMIKAKVSHICAYSHMSYSPTPPQIEPRQLSARCS